MTLDTRANAAVQALIDSRVAEGREVGVQVAAYLGNRPIVDAWTGLADPATGRKVDGLTLFNAFSVAKAATAVALHVQAERGLVEYDQPLCRYWPEFTGEGREKVTVRHALTHRSGLADMPPDVTAEQMADWDWMIRWLQQARPAFEPGTQSAYQSMTFGWLVGEVVRRTDPKKRTFSQFLHEDVGLPIGAPDLWIGLPDSEQSRVAALDDRAAEPVQLPTYRATVPAQVDLMRDPFGRPDIRRASIPGVGAIFTARSAARMFAMLANGGELDGVRLLSAERVESFARQREGSEDLDRTFQRVMFIGQGGLWLAGARGAAFAETHPRFMSHTGWGGSLGTADLERKLAIAFCHNRLEPVTANDGDIRVEVLRTIEQNLD